MQPWKASPEPTKTQEDVLEAQAQASTLGGILMQQSTLQRERWAGLASTAATASKAAVDVAVVAVVESFTGAAACYKDTLGRAQGTI